MSEQYQDKWVKGQCTSKGVRECADRYAVIKKFCGKFKRPFTVLDVGANLGYFVIRIAEDFPDSVAVAIEGPTADQLLQLLVENDRSNIILLNRTVTLDDLKALAEVEHFDLVLGLSVITHFPGHTYAEVLETMQSLGDNLILELPVEPNACGQAMIAQIELPAVATELGRGVSHLDPTITRPIVWTRHDKTTLKRAYLGSPREDMAIKIYSNFSKKSVSFGNKPESRLWIAGINLQTYLRMGGVYPSRSCIQQFGHCNISDGHGDINPWNFVLKGFGCTAIDYKDPNMTETMDDQRYASRVYLGLKMSPIASAADYRRWFDKEFAECKWKPHPDYSVFTQHDKEYYLRQRDGFEKKYRSMYAVAKVCAPLRIVELGTAAGSSADAYLSATKDAYTMNAVYKGYDLFGKNTRHDDGTEWLPLVVANKLLQAREFSDWSLHTADLRQLKSLPPADLVVVDAAHDYDNELADLRLALTCWPEYIYVDDTNGAEARRALETFLAENAARIAWTVAIDYPDGGTVIKLR